MLYKGTGAKFQYTSLQILQMAMGQYLQISKNQVKNKKNWFVQS